MTSTVVRGTGSDAVGRRRGPQHGSDLPFDQHRDEGQNPGVLKLAGDCSEGLVDIGGRGLPIEFAMQPGGEIVELRPQPGLWIHNPLTG